MKFKKWLKGRNHGAIAETLGISPAYLSQISGGIRVPSIATASGRVLINNILQVTDGEVRLEDLRPDEYRFFITESKRVEEAVNQ
jgi:DNA-binding transcriptional regulator YdaS (Cro superfamily)